MAHYGAVTRDKDSVIRAKLSNPLFFFRSPRGENLPHKMVEFSVSVERKEREKRKEKGKGTHRGGSSSRVISPTVVSRGLLSLSLSLSLSISIRPPSWHARIASPLIIGRPRVCSPAGRALQYRRGLKIRVEYSALPPTAPLLGSASLTGGTLHRPLFPLLLCFRRVRSVGRGPHRIAAGEVAVRARGVLQDPIPEPADEIRQAVAQASLAEDRLVPGDRAAVLRAPGWENADRDVDQGHAAQREQLQLALHVHDVTHRLATLGFRLINQPTNLHRPPPPTTPLLLPY